MELQILTRNDVTVSPAIEEYATTRISKMSRYLPRIDSGKVEISRGGHQATGPALRGAGDAGQQRRGSSGRRRRPTTSEPQSTGWWIPSPTASLAIRASAIEKGKDTVRTMEPAPTPEAPNPVQPAHVVKTKQFTVKPMAY